MITELQEMIRGASGMVFLDYRGLTCADMYELRRSLRPTGARVKVVKNRLMRIAFEREAVKGCDDFLLFNTAVAFAGADPVAAVKSISEFSASHQNAKIKGGFISRAPVALQELKALASLPGRRELLSRAAVCMKGVLYRAVGDFNGLLIRLCLDMKAHVRAKEGA